MARPNSLALLSRVAQMYYEEGLSQLAISAQLNISQASVSRYLKESRATGLVRIIVSVPPGVHTDLESGLRNTYGLTDAIVVDTSESDEESLMKDLGSAAAFYLETTIKKGEVIGLSSWSETLLAMVEALHPSNTPAAARVVQLLGGIGKSGAQKHATLLTERLAAATGAEAEHLSAPGVVGSSEARRALLADPYVQQTFAAMDSVTLALVGIGALEPSTLLAASGNIFGDDAIAELRDLGAVGDICLSFYDAEGELVATPLDDRVIAVELKRLREVPRVVGVAGGARKLAAIRGALHGKWINVLITDHVTAARLL